MRPQHHSEIRVGRTVEKTTTTKQAVNISVVSSYAFHRISFLGFFCHSDLKRETFRRRVVPKIFLMDVIQFRPNGICVCSCFFVFSIIRLYKHHCKYRVTVGINIVQLLRATCGSRFRLSSSGAGRNCVFGGRVQNMDAASHLRKKEFI